MSDHNLDALNYIRVASTSASRRARVMWNLRNLFNNDPNPYVLRGEDDLKPKRRTAFEDLFHSIKNLWAHTK